MMAMNAGGWRLAYFAATNVLFVRIILGGEVSGDRGMTVARVLLALSMMVAIGVGIVVLRGESAKVANRVQRLHGRQLVLEQDLWSREMELAKLRTPDEIRRRARELGLEVVPPKPDPNSKEGGGDKNEKSRRPSD